MAKKSGLGRGLESLLGETAGEITNGRDDVLEVALGEIVANRNQPRRNFDEEALAELAESIEKNGVLQPILVRRVGAKYEIVAGERRYRAASMAGLEKIPAVVREVSDEDMFKLALIENLQRSDLNPIETAVAYRRLMDEGGLTQDDLSKVVAKSRSNIANTLRLLDLSEDLQELVAGGKISSGHARALMRVKDEAERRKLAERVMKEELSVRQTENLASLVSGREGAAEAPKRQPVPQTYRRVAKELGTALGTEVKVRQVRGKNKIEIQFADESDLLRLVQLLSGNDVTED